MSDDQETPPVGPVGHVIDSPPPPVDPNLRPANKFEETLRQGQFEAQQHKPAAAVAIGESSHPVVGTNGPIPAPERYQPGAIEHGLPETPHPVAARFSADYRDQDHLIEPHPVTPVAPVSPVSQTMEKARAQFKLRTDANKEAFRANVRAIAQQEAINRGQMAQPAQVEQPQEKKGFFANLFSGFGLFSRK